MREKITRRDLLKRAGLAAGTAAAVYAAASLPKAATALAVTTITGDQPNGFTVAAGTTTEIIGTVTTPKNVVVYGTLVMRPGSALIFRDVVESAFVGGDTTVPVATDVGLWVFGSGVLDIQGTNKVPWTRGVNNDATWLAGDELRATPVAPTAAKATTAFTKGGTVPTSFGRKSEIINLTRDVRIEGQAGKRAHVFIRSDQPQTIKNVTIRYMGPRKSAGATGFVTGRYGLHFHLCGTGTTGSVVQNVVIRDCGAWGFVPHSSHGISFTGCITNNINSDSFTWDGAPAGQSAPITNNTLFDNCIATDMKPPSTTFYTITGFMLGRGTGNICRNSVAAANTGGFSSAGFHWHESANATPNVWTFDNNVAHHIAPSGIRVWQNAGDPHVITNYTGFANDMSIEHGAYTNRYNYNGITLESDKLQAIKLHALSVVGAPDQVIFENITINGRSRTPTAVRMTKHRVTGGLPVLFRDITVTGLTGTAKPVVVAQRDDSGFNPGSYDLVRFKVNGVDLEPADVQRLSVVGGTLRSQRSNNTAWSMNLATGAVTVIPPFAP